MIYLSGGGIPATLGRGDIGMMLTPAQGNRAPLRAGLPWAADNGVFSGKWVEAAWLTWLGQMVTYLTNCLFAVAPDVVGDAVATLARSLPYLPMIRRLGYRAALVGQDGLERLTVPWDSFDCFFIGGSTAWKLSEPAYALAAEAKQRGKWVHMGRVNSLQRLTACRVSGIDSADGTHVAFGPDRNLAQLCSWLDTLAGQSVMEAAS